MSSEHQWIIALHFLWAVYAIRRQFILYGGSILKIGFVGVVNFLFCPFCIMIAILRGK